VGQISAEVADGIEHLREILVRVVRTSSEDVNRRKTPRIHLERPCTLSFGGQSIEARLEDCSEGGLCVVGTFPSLAIGTRVEVGLTGLSQPVAALVREVGHDHVKAHLTVVADEPWKAARALLQPTLGQVA